MSSTAEKNRAVSRCRELVGLGPEAFDGEAGERFLESVGRLHPAGQVYRQATARAIAGSQLPGADAEVLAEEIFRRFLWTQFVCKLLMRADPEATASFVASHFDAGAVLAAVEAAGPSILSCFHYSAYPLVALGLAMSPAAPLLSKARVDFLEQAGADGPGDGVVYASSRSAAIRLTRTLRRGRSIWVLLDVVLPGVRTVPAEFLGRQLLVGAGLGKIARLSGRPCLPICWAQRPAGTPLLAATPVEPAERSEQEVIQAFVDVQSAFVARHPAEWLEWYSLLAEAPQLRAEVKHGNERLWQLLGEALG